MIAHYLSKKLQDEYHNLNLWYFVSFIFGIILFFKFTPIFTLNTIFTILFGTIILSRIFYKRDLLLFFLSACILSSSAGMLTSYVRMSSVSASTNPIKRPMISRLTGEVERIKPTLQGMQVTIKNVVLERNITKKRGKNLKKIRIHISNKLSRKLGHNDKLRFKAKLFPLQTSVLPGTYDFGFYMYMSGIEASGYALTPPEILSKNESTGSKYIQTIRNKVYHRLIQILGGDNGNFAAAILIGETKAIPKTISENMRNSGVAHVLSVSGLHLSLVAMLFFVSCRVILNCSNYFAYNTNIKIIAASASIIGSFMYLQISGSNIAATRAFIMSSVFIISLMLGRSPEPLRSIMIAAFLILLFFPEYIFHPSFQLSFAAVLCLISGYELYIKYENVINSAKGIFFSIKFYVYGNIYSSLLASIATAPFVIFHFYKFATYSVLMNLIAVPLMSFFMMPLGLISMLLMPFGADEFPLKALGFFISIVTSSAAYITALPASVWAWGHISPMSLAVFSLCFFWVCLWKTKWRLAGLAVMFLSLFMMNNTKKPDFIYDHTLKAIGLNSQRLGSPKLGSPRLEFQIYVHDKMPKFTSNYWVSWYGAKEASITRKKIAAKDLIFKLPSGKTVSLNYWRCTYADVQIITSKKLKCDNGGQVISNPELWKHKQILLYCDEKECSVQYREQNRWW